MHLYICETFVQHNVCGLKHVFNTCGHFSCVHWDCFVLKKIVKVLGTYHRKKQNRRQYCNFGGWYLCKDNLSPRNWLACEQLISNIVFMYISPPPFRKYCIHLFEFNHSCRTVALRKNLCWQTGELQCHPE